MRSFRPLAVPSAAPRRADPAGAKVDWSARIAQLVEHFHGKEGVTSSSLVPGFLLGCLQPELVCRREQVRVEARHDAGMLLRRQQHAAVRQLHADIGA